MQNSFLQSKGWEEFQKSVGQQTFRVDDVLLIKKSLPAGKSYLYAPVCSLRPSVFSNFLNKIKELAKKERSIFLRVEPQERLEIGNWKLEIVRSNDVQPSRTVILDLNNNEEELLANMHQKTRYNIRLAEKKGVKIKESQNIEDFWKLMKETTKRDGFRGYGEEYYREMLQIDPSAPLRFAQDDKQEMNVKLYAAEYENKILAAGIFVFYGDTATYLHGASTHDNKNVMAPYLLHWEMIKLAKKEGYKYYDFYGIDEKKWPGVTRFKKGFGGKEINYPGAFDIIFSGGWYFVYAALKRIKVFFK
ncbi:MAG: peptidoglycan bridge formation glycyltransferase FemA/FemB family protein [Patescibacteria group bacterium]|jgi:lipid II:glycine glycyltransferase (peptidoglycan interpeptide bridge formation enzyme)